MARVSCSVPKLSLWQRCLRAINRISDISPKTQDISTLLSAGIGTGEGWLALLESDKTATQDIPLVYFSDALQLVFGSLGKANDQLVVPWQHCITKNNLIV